MNISIYDLMDGYQENNIEITKSDMVSTEKIKEITRKRLELSENIEKQRPKRAVRYALVAVAAVLVLSAAALAASGYSLRELSKNTRELFGISDESVPEYVVYDSIEIPQEALYNCGREGRGEIYLSLSRSARSENLITQFFTASFITEEQCESLRWYWILEDGKTCVPAQLDDAYPPDWSADEPIYLNLRSVFIQDAEAQGGFKARLCAGRESADGKSLSVERISMEYTIELQKSYPTVELTLPEPFEFSYGDGHVGRLTKLEIGSERIIATLEVPGIYELYSETYGTGEHLTGEAWMSANRKLMCWYGDLEPVACGIELKLRDGTTKRISELCSYYEAGTSCQQGDVCLVSYPLRETLDTGTLESVVISYLYGEKEVPLSE